MISDLLSEEYNKGMVFLGYQTLRYRAVENLFLICSQNRNTLILLDFLYLTIKLFLCI